MSIIRFDRPAATLPGCDSASLTSGEATHE
jgi:hypothetical protein